MPRTELNLWLRLVTVIGRSKLGLVRCHVLTLLVLWARRGHHCRVERLTTRGKEGGMGEGRSHARTSGRVEQPGFPSVQDESSCCPFCHLPVQQGLRGGKYEGSGTSLLTSL